MAGRHQQTPAKDVHAGILLIVVASQTVSVLSSELSVGMPAHVHEMLFFSLIVWLSGCMLYLWIITLIFFRMEFVGIKPNELVPTYWINMGATAVSSLAGNTLAAHASSAPLISELLPFLTGLTLLFWATATWWIPFLLTAEVWRHSRRPFHFRFDPFHWSVVFPVGMYAVCTHDLGAALAMPLLTSLSNCCFAIAMVIWLVTFIAMCIHAITQGYLLMVHGRPEKF